MLESIKERLEGCPDGIKQLYCELRGMVLDAAPDAVERLWAKLPSYYVGARFVRLIPFSDHINVEASAASAHSGELEGYEMTPKGMLRLYPGAPLPRAVLARIISLTLLGDC